MSIVGYILDVGCGNMIAIKLPNGKNILVDCNITEKNKSRVCNFFRSKNFYNFDVFINTHRDVDHLRGIVDLHRLIPISAIYDNGFSGRTDADDYQEYMQLRRNLKHNVIYPQTSDNGICNGVTIQYMNGVYKDKNYDINDSSLVVKFEYCNCSILLAGDTSFKPWEDKILKKYGKEVHCSLLVASHHGSKSFFMDSSNSEVPYTEHIKRIKPGMTLISVGPNQWNLPDNCAVKLYEQYSNGSDKGNKVYLTRDNGNIKFELKENGGCTVTTNVA